MFHTLGQRVQKFWRFVSCGLLGYDMSRTHSIMRIATTASPVSGAEVCERSKAIAIAVKEANAKRSLLKVAQKWLQRSQATKRAAAMEALKERRASLAEESKAAGINTYSTAQYSRVHLETR